MGKPSPTRDTSFSWNYMPRHIAHRVAMHQQYPNAANAFIPKMAKQKFAFSAGLRTRMLTWKAIPEVLHNEAIQAGACTGTCTVTGLRTGADFGPGLGGCSVVTKRDNQWPNQMTNEKCKERVVDYARSHSGLEEGKLCCAPLLGAHLTVLEVDTLTCCPNTNILPLICPLIPI